jgi:hypothetical protein
MEVFYGFVLSTMAEIKGASRGARPPKYLGKKKKKINVIF